MIQDNLDENNKYLYQNSQMSQALSQLKIKLQNLNKFEEKISQGNEVIKKVKDNIQQSQSNIQSRKLIFGKAEQLKNYLNNDNSSLQKRLKELEEKDIKAMQQSFDQSSKNNFESDLRNIDYRRQKSAAVLDELRVLKETQKEKEKKIKQDLEDQKNNLKYLQNERFSKEKSLDKQITVLEDEISNKLVEKDKLKNLISKEEMCSCKNHDTQRSNAEREVLEENSRAKKIEQEYEKDHIEMLIQKKIQLQPEVNLLKQKLNIAEDNCMNQEKVLSELNKQLVQQTSQTRMIQWVLLAVVILLLFQECYKFIF